MNDYVIFTFGQIETLRAVLSALAAIFNPVTGSFFATNTTFGGGVGVTLAAIIAMMGIFTSYFRGQPIQLHGPIISVVLYGLLTVPKAPNTFIIDNYTGQVEVVQDIPLGIAAVGHAMSTISRNVTEVFETQYSIPGEINSFDFDYSMTNGNGFLSPLKVMLALRENIFTYAPEHLKYNSIAYFKSCLLRTRTAIAEGESSQTPFRFNEYAASNDPLDYFLNPALTEDYLLEYMNPADDSLNVGNCSQVRTLLGSNADGGVDYFLQDCNTAGEHALRTLLKSNEARTEQYQAGNAPNCNDALTNTDQAVTAMLKGDNADRNYMKMRFMQDMNNTLLGSGSTSSYVSSTYATAMTTNVELTAAMSAIEGETFLHYMLPAMNFIIAIWYATWPIVLLVMVAKGTEALTFYGSYLGIGLWMMSWLPVASVINFVTISSLIQDFEALRSSMPLSLSAEPDYYITLQSALTVGSNLLGATPLITLALISGSMFALTGVAQSAATPTGGASEAAKAITPSLKNQAQIMSTVPSYNSDPTQSSQFWSQKGSEYASSKSLAQSNVFSNGIQSMKKATEQTSANFDQAWNQLKGKTWQTVTQDANGVNQTGSITSRDVFNSAIQEAKNTLTGNSFTGSKKFESAASVSPSAVIASARDTIANGNAEERRDAQDFLNTVMKNASNTFDSSNVQSITDSEGNSFTATGLVSDLSSQVNTLSKQHSLLDTFQQNSSLLASNSSNSAVKLKDVIDNLGPSGLLNNGTANYVHNAAKDAAMAAGFNEKAANLFADKVLEDATAFAQDVGAVGTKGLIAGYEGSLLDGNENFLEDQKLVDAGFTKDKLAEISQTGLASLWSTYDLTPAPVPQSSPNSPAPSVKPETFEDLPDNASNAIEKTGTQTQEKYNGNPNEEGLRQIHEQNSQSTPAQRRDAGRDLGAALGGMLQKAGLHTSPNGISNNAQLPTGNGLYGLHNGDGAGALAALHSEQAQAITQDGFTPYQAFMSNEALNAAAHAKYGNQPNGEPTAYRNLDGPQRDELLNQQEAAMYNAAFTAFENQNPANGSNPDSTIPQSQYDALSGVYNPLSGKYEDTHQGRENHKADLTNQVTRTLEEANAEQITAMTEDRKVQSADNDQFRSQADEGYVTGKTDGLSTELVSNIAENVKGVDPNNEPRMQQAINQGFEDTIADLEGTASPERVSAPDFDAPGEYADTEIKSLGQEDPNHGNALAGVLDGVKNLKAMQAKFNDLVNNENQTPEQALLNLVDEKGFNFDGGGMHAIAASLGIPLASEGTKGAGELAEKIRTTTNDGIIAQGETLKDDVPNRHPNGVPRSQYDIDNDIQKIDSDVKDKIDANPKSKLTELGDKMPGKYVAGAAGIAIGAVSGISNYLDAKENADGQTQDFTSSFYGVAQANSSTNLDNEVAKGNINQSEANGYRRELATQLSNEFFNDDKVLQDVYNGDTQARDNARDATQALIQDTPVISGQDLGAMTTQMVDSAPHLANDFANIQNQVVFDQFGDRGSNVRF